MRERIINRVLGFLILMLVSTQARATEGKSSFSVYAGTEYMHRNLKLVSVASGTLFGYRFGLGKEFSLGGDFGLKLSSSIGYSTGENAMNSAKAREDFTSWDVKPTVYLRYKRLAAGIAVRYESFRVVTQSSGAYTDGTYRGLEYGPSAQFQFASISKFDFTIGGDYLVGKLNSIESTQIGGKIQIGYSF